MTEYYVLFTSILLGYVLADLFKRLIKKKEPKDELYLTATNQELIDYGHQLLRLCELIEEQQAAQTIRDALYELYKKPNQQARVQASLRISKTALELIMKYDPSRSRQNGIQRDLKNLPKN